MTILLRWIPQDPFTNPPAQDPQTKHPELAKETDLEEALAEAMGIPFEARVDIQAIGREVREAVVEKAKLLQDRTSTAFGRIQALTDPREQVHQLHQLIIDTDMYFEVRKKPLDARMAATLERFREELDTPEEQEASRIELGKFERELTTYLIQDVGTFHSAYSPIHMHTVFVIINGNLFITPYGLSNDDGKSPKWSLRKNDGIKVLKLTPPWQDMIYQLIIPPPPGDMSRNSLVHYYFEHIPSLEGCTKLGDDISFREAKRWQQEKNLTFQEGPQTTTWNEKDRVIIIERFSEEKGLSHVLFNRNHRTHIPCSHPSFEEQKGEDDFVILG